MYQSSYKQNCADITDCRIASFTIAIKAYWFSIDNNYANDRQVQFVVGDMKG